jgi:hypothetical protein
MGVNFIQRHLLPATIAGIVPPVPVEVLSLTGENYDVICPVVSLVAVDVVNYFAFFKWPPKYFLGDYAVFVSPELFCVGETLAGAKVTVPQLLSGLRSHPCGI